MDTAGCITIHVKCLYDTTELMKASSWVVILITVLRYSHMSMHCSTIHVHKVLTDINAPSSMNIQVEGLLLYVMRIHNHTG